MDIFEKHFEMLKKNQNIFETYKMSENLGIEISNEIKEGYLKTGKELLVIEKSEQLMEVRSIHYHNVLIKKLEEYALPEWLVCLNEKVLLEYAIPILSRVLQKYPMLCGMNNEWQVLYDITKVNPEFWQVHEDWKKYFNKIINKVLSEYSASLMSIPEEYLYQFNNFIGM